MRPATGVLCVLAAALLGCGKDPFAGRKGSNEETRAPIDTPAIPTNAERFDRGMVEAYEKLVTSRLKRDAKAWRAAFSAEPGEDAQYLFEESTGAGVTKILYQFQKADVNGERATLLVKEILEEKNPKAGMHNQEITVTATLARSGGAWKVEALKADWK